MDAILIVALAFIAVAIITYLSCLYLKERNELVYAERRRILELVGKRCKEAITNNDMNWKRYYDWFEKIPYDRMLLQVWKPVTSFYDESELRKGE